MDARMGGNLPGLILVLALAVVAAGCGAAPPGRAAGPPRTDSLDLVALHTARSPQFRAACLDCHADITKRTTLDPKFKEAHLAMITSLPDYDAKVGVTNDTCASCHTRVDVVQHSGVLLRRNSDVASCQACHGQGGMASKKFYAN